jgi:hypothetical protein
MNAAAEPLPTPSRRPRILLSGADPALAALLGEWLADMADLQIGGEEAAGGVALQIVDVPYPRRVDSARDPSDPHDPRRRPRPVLMLSSTFFGGVDCHGPGAAALGVDGVLPKPVAREALLAAVRRLLGPAP